MPLIPDVNSFFPFQMVALNFDHILLMLKDMGSILRDTLHSQDGLNLGDIRFCPLIHTLHMQFLSLDSLCILLANDAFMPPQSERAPELSGMTAILLVFQADSRHKKITNIYMGLMIRRVESHLYNPGQIPSFIKDIEGNLQAARNTLKAGGNPGKKCAYCLYVDNLSGAMSVPTDPPYCLVYPTSYVKGVEPDHFDTHNSPMGMHLHRCVCCATLQLSNDDPKEHTKYVGSHLILPCRVQYNDWLYPAILELQNHCGPLIDPTTGEPYPMEMVGNFRAVDPIFKGCYRDSLLYSNANLARLRCRRFISPHSGGDPRVPCPILLASQGASCNQAIPAQGGSFGHTGGVPPRLNSPTARVDPSEALDTAPIPQLRSAQILHLPRNPLAPRSQPRTIRQSLHRPAALTSTAIHPLPPQGQQDTNEEIFAGRTLVQSTPLFPSAPACLTPSVV